MGKIATKNADGWSVEDPNGGVWWPDNEARREIEGAADPAREAVRICATSPMLGRWSS